LNKEIKSQDNVILNQSLLKYLKSVHLHTVQLFKKLLKHYLSIGLGNILTF